MSLIFVAKIYDYLQLAMFDTTHLPAAVLSVALFAIVSVLFTVSRFSFGYFLGFYFYTMILGYLWLLEFSRFHYDHTLAAVSAFVSGLAFLVPALFITSPIRKKFILPARAFDYLLSLILILAAAVIAAGALYNFRLVGLADIYDFRAGVGFPAWLSYAIGATSNALLPFAFACFVARRNRWRAAAILLLLLLFYPLTLTKLALFAPLWLLFLALLPRLFDARTSVVLSLFLPLSAGVVLAALVQAGALPQEAISQFFGAVNFRMVAFPSAALDVYSDFFSTHDHTYFCQIWFLKPFMACPYHEYLSILMERTYHTRQSECIAVCDGRHCLRWTGAGAARGARVRTGDCRRQPSLVRTAAGICAGFGRHPSSGLPECAAYDDFADERGRAAVSALVHYAARYVRSEGGRGIRCFALISGGRVSAGVAASRSDCSTIDDPNPTDYHSAPAE